MEERLAVFDFDGTLYGKLFPIYISSGLEHNMIRELIDGTLDE